MINKRWEIKFIWRVSHQVNWAIWENQVHLYELNEELICQYICHISITDLDGLQWNGTTCIHQDKEWSEGKPWYHNIR